MVVHDERFSVYLDAYRKERLNLLDKIGPIAGEYSETVRTTWKRSFDAVAAASPAASALLQLSAFFAPDAIPYELILEGAPEFAEPLASALAFSTGDEHTLNPLLTPLARHSLVRRDREARTYSVHRLVQAVLLDELTDATRKDLAERAVKALNRTFPDVDYANWSRCERLVSHALAARGWIEGENLRVPAAAQLLNQAGYYLYVRARYAEAEPLYRRALAIWKVAPGHDHPDTAQGLNNLAVLLRIQGHLHGEAEELARGAGDHATRRWAATTVTRPSASSTWRCCSRPRVGTGRRSGYTAALVIREKALGSDNPDVAQSLDDVSAPPAGQGRLDEAEQLYRSALTIWEKALGPDHPDTARGVDSLAHLHRAQGRLGEAEPLYRRALAIREKAPGPGHPYTLRTRNTSPAGPARRGTRARRCGCTASCSQTGSTSSDLITPTHWGRATGSPTGPARRGTRARRCG